MTSKRQALQDLLNKYDEAKKRADRYLKDGDHTLTEESLLYRNVLSKARAYLQARSDGVQGQKELNEHLNGIAWTALRSLFGEDCQAWMEDLKLPDSF